MGNRMGTTPNIPVIDPAQDALDRKRELDIKEREVAAHEREVLAQEEELKRSRWLNPTVIGIFAAAFGLIGSVFVARVNNSNTQEVQRLQSEASITLEAIKTGTGNTDAACKNLLFFVSLDLIRDPNKKIENQCKGAPAGPPSLPTAQVNNQTQSFPLNGQVVDATTKEGVIGALITIRPAGGFNALASAASSFIFSGKDGSFALALPSSYGANLQINAQKDGYLETQMSIHSSGKVVILLQRAK